MWIPMLNQKGSLKKDYNKATALDYKLRGIKKIFPLRFDEVEKREGFSKFSRGLGTQSRKWPLICNEPGLMPFFASKRDY